eukprot:UN4573
MWTANQPQWDFTDSLQWLKQVQVESSVERALGNFLEGHRQTPTRNRQALYLIGFDRDAVRRPGELYDWDRNHTGLLELAKEHLNQTLFGITDCYDTSLKVITEKLGWNTSKAVNLADHQRFRGKTDTRTHMSKTFWFTYSRLPDFLNQTFANKTSTRFNHTRPLNTWRGVMPPKLVNYIENWNSVDMELYEYALQLFKERYNKTCKG